MNYALALTGPQLATYERIFQHPQADNLGWTDVRALFERIGTVEDEPSGALKLICNGLSLVLHPDRKRNVSSGGQIMAIRRFLIESAGAPGGS